MVQIAACSLVLGVCFKLNWLALLDPTEPEANKSTLFAGVSFFIALATMIVVNWAFKKSLRFAPTLIGMMAGFWFSIYIISSVNGIGGVLTPRLPSQAGSSQDYIGPMWGAIIELFFSLVGALIGYRYSMIFILLI